MYSVLFCHVVFCKESIVSHVVFSHVKLLFSVIKFEFQDNSFGIFITTVFGSEVIFSLFKIPHHHNKTVKVIVETIKIFLFISEKFIK